MKDPADVVAALAPLGQERRLRLLRYWLVGEASDEETRQLAEAEDRRSEELRAKWPDGERLTWAWRLALDIETCGDLIVGRAVNPARLNQQELARAMQTPLVRLDVRPIDLLLEETA